MPADRHLILCVDDDPQILANLQVVLEANGYSVAQAQSAEEGLRVYKQAPPDLVILDHMMEEIDAGARLVKDLQALGNTAPIYLLSAAGEGLSRITDPSSLGLSGVLQKPIANSDLLSLLASKLG